jgi:hypothetical protein
VNQGAISTALFDPVARQTMEWTIHWLFRIALFCEFVGAWWEVIERGSSYAAPLLWIGFQQCVDHTCWHAFGVRRLLRSQL